MKDCDDKQRFETWQEASNTLAAINNKPQRIKKGSKLPNKVYYCDGCGGYHLSTEGKRRNYIKSAPVNVRTNKPYKEDRRLVIRNFTSKPPR